MNFQLNRYTSVILLLTCLLLAACDQPKPPQEPVEKKKPQASLKKYQNIRYTEVRRYFNTGYSLTEKGYMLEPNWRLSFVSEDSANIYNPRRKMFVNTPLIHDHDSVFNIAWAYLRLKYASKDSIIFQVLRTEGKVVHNETSNVYMMLYADDYIRNVLHKDPLSMQVATPRDSALVRRLTAEASKDPSKAFAARKMVSITSRSPMVKVKRVLNDDRSTEEKMVNDSPPIDYLSPEYEITVNKAYADFSYYFTIYVDANGKMIYAKYMVPLDPPFSEDYPYIIKKLMEGYMKAYLNITPGSTYGIAHTSEVIIRLSGKK
ncbi:hypothetical protein [Mucilaginibacter myungsuensis]|uniref:Lipoprotein n=1 Tax=Mucilaginibacter myungsuensis TaxID=649104 RepID=A0A929KT15_9SPHI|nr:hypothetical protein [Mucilaginibacter myungsuensis]MBE9660642.1 hypothetical protein [Mucilaginibacter myungsuensis]MDN3600687.1 hypothetical protein [Mucilaginibacter myungsuensis]